MGYILPGVAADPTYDPTEFQDALRSWMERNALSQMAAAHTIGVSQGILNRWLKPRGDEYLVQPEVRALEKLAAVRGFGVDIMQLKRMCGRLSPDDLAVLRKLTPDGPPDHRLEGLVSDIRTGWLQLRDDEAREHAAEVIRAAVRLHHSRTRKPREKRSNDGSESPRRDQLMVA